jgi:hypothetical protein
VRVDLEQTTASPVRHCRTSYRPGPEAKGPLSQASRSRSRSTDMIRNAWQVPSLAWWGLQPSTSWQSRAQQIGRHPRATARWWCGCGVPELSRQLKDKQFRRTAHATKFDIDMTMEIELSAHITSKLSSNINPVKLAPKTPYKSSGIAPRQTHDASCFPVASSSTCGLRDPCRITVSFLKIDGATCL